MEESGLFNKRRHRRIPFNNKVKIRGEGFFQGVEISVGGMYIKTQEPYPVGGVLDLQFKLSKTDASPINVQGCVLYSHKHAGFGLGFLNLKPEDYQKIEEFIEQAGE